ncbi:MAG: thiamine diphosphokinase, partial [Anaerolineae bacterium]|nr:thiamine diphosphokinase [Thermoflexales bacterium]MDW8409039.1 thiamine diphosphokinase [Anaerolineae bacterium]
SHPLRRVFLFVMKRAIIFANGELPEPAAVRGLIQPDDLLIAADGGARHCRALGLTPHLVIGDFDSLDAAELGALEQAGATLRQHPRDKDETDLELALLEAAARGASYLVVLGAFGGRLDMTLANIQLLLHPKLAGVRVELRHRQPAAAGRRCVRHRHARPALPAARRGARLRPGARREQRPHRAAGPHHADQRPAAHHSFRTTLVNSEA